MVEHSPKPIEKGFKHPTFKTFVPELDTVLEIEEQPRFTGGMGAIYYAWSEEHQQPIAVKTTTQDSLEGEAYRLGRMGRHIQDSVMRVFGVSEQPLHKSKQVHTLNQEAVFSEHTAFLEWADPETAPNLEVRIVETHHKPEEFRRFLTREEIRQHPKAMDLSTIRTVILQIGNFIDDQAERNNLLHRDIKPGNIMLDNEGQVFFGDAGLSIEADDIRPVISFSPAYIPADRFYETPPERWHDIYACGLVTFEMLTGRLPYDISTHTNMTIVYAAAVDLYHNGLDSDATSLLRKKMAGWGVEADPVIAVLNRVFMYQQPEMFTSGREFAMAMNAALKNTAVPAHV